MDTGNGSDQATLDYTLKYNPPMDLAVAERNLKEIKGILDGLGVVFLLGSGSCLGATRNKAFIPWDDDVDLLTVIGANGLTEEKLDTAVAALREKGYFVGELDAPHSTTKMTVKDHVRISLEALRIEDDCVYAYPGISLPALMFIHPKEIEFLGERFNVPNPPEEYLALKYGAEWMVPKKAGAYEKDVVEKMPVTELSGRPSWIRVLNEQGRPVAEAEVTVGGGGRSRTNENGYAEIILPAPNWYALVIKYPGHEEVLYMEQLEPDRTYVYRADAMARDRSLAGGEVGSIGNVLLQE